MKTAKLHAAHGKCKYFVWEYVGALEQGQRCETVLCFLMAIYPHPTPLPFFFGLVVFPQ